jgi:hypothetical protein
LHTHSFCSIVYKQPFLAFIYEADVYLVPEREVDFVFSDNVLDSDPLVEVGDLAEAAAAEAGKTTPLTD